VQTSLLETKLRIPPTPRVIFRPRLVDALERSVRDTRLVLISAPAGCGKTTLLAQWSRASSLPVAWFSVGAEDNVFDRFFRSLVSAWAFIDPRIMDSPVGLLLGGPEPDRDTVLAALINVANANSDHMVFVLDDAHLVEKPAIIEALVFLLDHLPGTLHFVLAGRAELPLPLARYRARNQLREFGAEDLQFRIEETTDLLNGLLRLELTEDRIDSLHAQVEGWIAGLQLVSLNPRRLREATPLAVSGRHRFIADYLSEEVLAGLPAETRLFLVQTCILERLCGPLCDAVTGRNDSQEALEAIERASLFLVPLDENREWFRYHRLFADFLRAELHRRHPDEVADLHRKAAQWHLDHDLSDAAFDHALAAEDADQVIQILDRYESVKLHGGELRLLQDWLDAIPAAWYAAHPMLGLVRAGVLAFTGELEACVRCVDDVEQRIAQGASDETQWQQARICAFRCFVACFANDLAQAEKYAAQALRDLRSDDRDYRQDIHHALGDTYRGHGRWEDARDHYLEVLHLAGAPADGVREAHVYGALADLDLRQGRLRDAESHWQRALTAVKAPVNWGRIPLPVTGWVFLRLAEIHYERNDLAQARVSLARGRERAALGGDVRSMIAGSLLAARINLTEGEVEAAADDLEQARPLVERASFSDWSSRFERLQIELWLAQDRLRSAVAWADAMLADDTFEGSPDSESAQMALVRVLTVRGDRASIERAQALLRRLLETVAAEGRAGVQIEALALRALASWHSGDRAGAVVSLEHALRLAEPEVYVRLFADLGLPMARLLQEVRNRNVMPDYVATLLAACGAGPMGPLVADRPLSEPLSQREEDVLRLIAAGLTNREIGDTLFISPETVKKHTGNIYAKLVVSHRTEAVARARRLGILPDRT
jgi:LuxR family maltose regulon positive regulatory protein